MNFQQTLSGQKKKWTLRSKLGEGDAGEVYLVQSLLDGKPAILKRPQGDAFMGDVLRQASQIRSEGQVLLALEGARLDRGDIKLHVPVVLDQSPVEGGNAGGFFIVIERAEGIDLNTLLRIANSGTVQAAGPISQQSLRRFARSVAGSGIIPAAVITRCLIGLLQLLETIHTSAMRIENDVNAGVIWNDVKPEHLFWDPEPACLTVIDWGNAAFLEEGGATIDRQHSTKDDFRQYIESMGDFLKQADPDLLDKLAWPDASAIQGDLAVEIGALKQRLLEVDSENQGYKHELRESEADLLAKSAPGLEDIKQLHKLQAYLLGAGEIPDYSSGEPFYTRAAINLSAVEKLGEFSQVCEQASYQTMAQMRKWNLLGHLAGLLQDSKLKETSPGLITTALAAGAAGDWAELIWNLHSAIGENPLPEWWQEFSSDLRREALGLEDDALAPHVAVHRLYYTLQNTVLKNGSGSSIRPDMGGAAEGETAPDGEALKNYLDEEVVKKWRQLAPDPPYSGIGYDGINEMLIKIEGFVPDAAGSVKRILDQPVAQASIALHAWDQKDFETARRALRQLLVWDPSRRRLLRAEEAIQRAPLWLKEVRDGAKNGQPFYEFLAAIELAGRNLRSQVGPADWLDAILEALKRLRKGDRPADLLIEHAHLAEDLPWLNEFRSREVLSLPRQQALSLEREEIPNHPATFIDVEQHARLGPDGDLQLGVPLDTWSPEARGSSARVFAADPQDRQRRPLPAAYKIMRPGAQEYALPLFREEASILAALRDVPGITPLVECGYVKLDEGQDLPGDESHQGGELLHGSLERYRAEQVQNFLAVLDARATSGWLPYLALLRRDHKGNLLKYCDAGATRGWFLPLEEGLLLCVQILDILQSAHERGIVYRDHKILHYYWSPESHGVVMIDWNIAQRHPQGLSESETSFDLVQFGARAMHHILTGRPAPGALPLGPNRPEEIEQASTKYGVNWTYDDERLPERVKEILATVLNQGYAQAKSLRADLAEIYQQIVSGVEPAREPTS